MNVSKFSLADRKNEATENFISTKTSQLNDANAISVLSGASSKKNQLILIRVQLFSSNSWAQSSFANSFS